MKHIIVLVAVLVFAWALWGGQQEFSNRAPERMEPPAEAMPTAAPSAVEADSATPLSELSAQAASATVAPPTEEPVSRVINIGEPIAPDDPSTWPQSDNIKVINIGEPMDPDDPSTWPQSDDTEIINIGEPMDPEDPSTWPQSDNTEVINIGESMDPDDPYTWPQSDNRDVINVGEPMDPDDLSAWPTL